MRTNCFIWFELSKKYELQFVDSKITRLSELFALDSRMLPATIFIELSSHTIFNRFTENTPTIKLFTLVQLH